MEGVSTIKKEGKLKKEGGRVKTWKNRWCVLSDGYLCYHDGSNKSGELKGKRQEINRLLIYTTSTQVQSL